MPPSTLRKKRVDRKDVCAGMRLFEPAEWEAAGVSGPAIAEQELKSVLQGLAKHLFGDVEVGSYSCCCRNTIKGGKRELACRILQKHACVDCNSSMHLCRTFFCFQGGASLSYLFVTVYVNRSVRAFHFPTVPMGGRLLPLHGAVLRAGNLLQRRMAGGAGLRVCILSSASALAALVSL